MNRLNEGLSALLELVFALVFFFFKGSILFDIFVLKSLIRSLLLAAFSYTILEKSYTPQKTCNVI